MERTNFNIGTKIRTLRKNLNYTIQEVADQAKITRSLLSQIETGKTTPSINSLMSIANALNVPIASFFEEENHPNPVIQATERKKLKIKSNVEFYLLTPDVTHHKLESFYNVYAPGSSTGPLYSHTGEEFGFVLKGQLEVLYGNKKYILKEGDSITIDSSKPHKFRNSTREQTIVIWVNTPPSW